MEAARRAPSVAGSDARDVARVRLLLASFYLQEGRFEDAERQLLAIPRTAPQYSLAQDLLRVVRSKRCAQ